MEPIIFTFVAGQALQRTYEVARSVYQAVPKTTSPIVIEITSADGKTSSKETITPICSPIDVISSKTSSLLETLSYHLHTLLLFTYSDAKTVLIPWTLFGIGHALSASFFGLTTQSSTLRILSRTPQILAWLWLNLLPFDIGNQRHPTAIVEDAVNKPWRPLPAKRITSSSARLLMVASYTVAFLFSLRYGGASQCLVLAVLGYIHNDLGGGDNSWVARNMLNGLGFISFGSGAMEVAFGRGAVSYSPMLTQWLRIIALVVFTCIQTQDMYDQEGDALVKRSTLPLVIGDEACRWSIAITVLFWSFFCPYFWSLGLVGYILPVLGGFTVAKRTLKKKTVEADRKTYKLWNLWLVAIYCLPLAKVIGAAVMA